MGEGDGEGRVIAGIYRLRTKLGEGGMGHVFEADVGDGGGRAAIKLMRAGSEEADVRRFERELEIAGQLDSQNIVRVIDVGTDPETGFPFMAMECLDGEDLSALLARTGALPPSVALRIASQVCSGLAKAHDAGIVHRDIKPSNVFLAPSEAGDIVVKLLDFGIAKLSVPRAYEPASTTLTQAGGFVGTPHYASPEQAQGVREVTASADTWSVGVLLFQMLVGRVPYAGYATFAQIVGALCTVPIEPVQKLAPWVDPNVAHLIHWALRKNPGERFENAREMGHAIRAIAPSSKLVASELRGLDAGDRAVKATRAELPPDDGVFRITPKPVRTTDLHVADTVRFGPASVRPGDAETVAMGPPPRAAKSERRAAVPAVAIGIAVILAMVAVGFGRQPAPETQRLPLDVGVTEISRAPSAPLVGAAADSASEIVPAGAPTFRRAPPPPSSQRLPESASSPVAPSPAPTAAEHAGDFAPSSRK